MFSFYKYQKIIDVSIDLDSFFIISFYFSYNTFISRNIIKIKQRFIRLLIPYTIWPIIFFIFDNFTHYINKKKIGNFKYLYYQLLIGTGIHPIFWFQFNLIFLSLFFTIIILIYRKRYLLNLFLIGIICYLFIYYSSVTLLFTKYNNIAIFSTRKIPSSYIYSLIGLFLFSIKIIEKTKNLNKYKIKIILLCIIILFLCLYIKYLFPFYPYYLIFLHIFDKYF